MVKCPHCGHENESDKVLCDKCSLPLKLEKVDETDFLEDGDANLGRSGPMPIGTARMGSEKELLLRIRDHDEPVKVYLKGSLILGRRDSSTGEIAGVGLDEFNARELGVSRQHTELTYENGIVQVKDLGSKNATFLNGQKLIAHQSRILRDGDELRLGRLVIHVYFPK
jgi:pSer/pThr/pTyr-binding forkhead associated (FHA) protein